MVASLEFIIRLSLMNYFMEVFLSSKHRFLDNYTPTSIQLFSGSGFMVNSIVRI